MMYAIDGLVVAILVKATVVVAVGLAGARLARGSRAAVRHAVLAAAFAVMLGLPVASVIVPPVRVAMPMATVFVDSIDAAPQLASSSERTVTPPAISRWSLPSMADLLIAGWLAGALFFLLRMMFGLWQVHSLRRFGLPWRDGQAVVDRLAMEVGIRWRVAVLLHESVSAPVTCGVIGPAIVLPPDAESWSAEDLNRALVHELEHVRRGDWVSHCLARAVCAVYWFHPLVWMAWRRLALEAERACDDAVLSGSEATLYADQLVGLARRLSANRKSPALAMANRSDLSARVGAVLDSGQRRGRAGKMPVALVCATAVVVLVMMSPLRMVAAPQSGSGKAVDQPAFEVASVKPRDPNGREIGGLYTYPGGRVVAKGCRLEDLIAMAFDTELFQFPGAPGWVNDDRVRFDIEAKPPASSASSKANPPYPKAPPTAEQRQMLQTLLVERFDLRFHRETKEASVYLLVRNNGKLTLQEPKDKDVYPWAGTAAGGPPFSMGIAGINISMTQLAKRLSPVMARPVLDKTGLNGSFDFRYEADSGDTHPDVISSISVSLQGLGLKLEASKAPVETVVIDHAQELATN
jgi:uncharacterized protein (TIGR03435 family)